MLVHIYKTKTAFLFRRQMKETENLVIFLK